MTSLFWRALIPLAPIFDIGEISHRTGRVIILLFYLSHRRSSLDFFLPTGNVSPHSIYYISLV
jgi:hypothetical protein